MNRSCETLGDKYGYHFANSKYDVLMIYEDIELLDNSIWSRYSSPISFTTLDEPAPFHWDPSNDNKTLTGHSSGNWRKCASKNVLNGYEIAKVEWEITVHGISSTWYFMMGYIEHSKIDATNLDGSLSANKEHAIASSLENRCNV